MTIARYYVWRLPTPQQDLLTIRAPNPWTWARVRGSKSDGTRLINIAFTGGTDTASLIARVTSLNTELVGSRYEIILGDATSKPDDPALRATGQKRIAGAGVTLVLGNGYAKMDEDPPPPPGDWHFDWDFEPTDIIG